MLVFAVKGRESLLPREHKVELQKFITGVVTNKKSKFIIIENEPDHIHLLVGLKPDTSISDLVRDIKSIPHVGSTNNHGRAQPLDGKKDSVRFHIRARNSAMSSRIFAIKRSITKSAHSGRNTLRCSKHLASNTMNAICLIFRRADNMPLLRSSGGRGDSKTQRLRTGLQRCRSYGAEVALPRLLGLRDKPLRSVNGRGPPRVFSVIRRQPRIRIALFDAYGAYWNTCHSFQRYLWWRGRAPSRTVGHTHASGVLPCMSL
jgi:REP element-mobilizing transposase RayT